MIIVAGRLQSDQVDRDRYVAECVAVVQQARTAAGCLDFAITADPVEPDRINVYERGSQMRTWNGSAVRVQTPSRLPSSAMRKCGNIASPPPRTRDLHRRWLRDLAA